MSKLSSPEPSGLRRRADAVRSRAAILDAACRVLSEQPEASIEEIATAAGVTRQTVYAHFPVREQLIRAVIDSVTEESVAVVTAAALDEGPPAAALVRLLRASWQFLARYPFLLNRSIAPMGPQEAHERHEPVLAPLERLIRRGQEAGEFDHRLSPSWLLAAVIALGEAAGAEVVAGRMTADEAAFALEHTVLRVFGVASTPSSPSSPSRHTRE
jgi:AcrR family transcriptional regulator